MDINIKLSKRAAELIQEKEQAINYLNINAVLNDAVREFKRKDKEHERSLKETIKEIIS